MLPDERSNHPPLGLVAFNKAIMKHGARLPLHPLVREILNHFELAPSQLSPNAYKLIAGTFILWRKVFGEDLPMNIFCHIYKPSSKAADMGYYYFTPYERKIQYLSHLPYQSND